MLTTKHIVSMFSLMILFSLMQAWQLKLVPLEDAPIKASDKLGAKPNAAQQTPAKEYGCDLPFKQPAPDRTADDVVLALCAGPGGNGAAPADNRLHPFTISWHQHNCTCSQYVTPIHHFMLWMELLIATGHTHFPFHVFSGTAHDSHRSNPTYHFVP